MRLPSVVSAAVLAVSSCHSIAQDLGGAAQIASRASISRELASPPAKAQSGIQLGRPARETLRSLALLGKVWGFLKYHHPDAISGRLNWDRELLDILPRVIASQSHDETQSILSRWIAGLSKIPACLACRALDPRGLQSAPRLRWLDNVRLLGKPLGDQLKMVYLNRSGGAQHYLSLQPGVGNPVFEAEESYPDLQYPDSGYQILAVFRFWNIVEYWYPYRDLIGDEWDEVLLQALEDAAPMQDRESFQRALFALIARVRDGHANLWSSLRVRPPVGDCQLPVNLRWIETNLTVESYASGSGREAVQLGEIIEAIDGQPIAQFTAYLRPYYVGSNDAARAADIASSIGRGDCGTARLTVKRPGGSMAVSVERQPVGNLDTSDSRRNDRSGEVIQRLDEQTIYLRISLAKPDDVSRLFEQAMPGDRLVVDLRGYPASAVAHAIAASLISEPAPFVRYTHVDPSNPGAIYWSASHAIHPGTEKFDGKVAILVDESTMSSGEFTAMALQASSKTITVGSQTAGADGNISAIPLPGGFMAAISGIGVYYPDGEPTQRVGVKIDKVCSPQIEALRSGADPVLECALRSFD